MTKSERTKQFIIEQSAPLFNTKGIAGTAMSDVMEVTKLAKGSLYGHFDSKDELSYAVVDFNLSKLVGRVEQAVNRESSAKDKLLAFLDTFATPMQFPVEGGCPMVNFGSESDDTNPVVRSKVKATILSAQARIAAIIEYGIARKEFKSTFNASEFAIKMMTLIEGGVLIGRVLESNTQMETIIAILKKEISQELS
ncbi:TetR/AcrR family transcriptional regulator [Pedobacter sp. ISL-68]|uniref:TetR/AcrR family transcriptional regulator n=1 Tax=unclassified Pedobacter TaxID=2628915 RepID=UPI001BEAF145|nr:MULTISPECIES: TetR/AcrR family transcriptional regulator [unclassified Pedobacter]MBT2560071.1 TetR/AcrR family transcriptional regulator [Pedobacter sp. ISL-64]MBT2589050.1 TetR/AcrR family transcriptional regulator [Pedobacter sp. ISL-68]